MLSVKPRFLLDSQKQPSPAVEAIEEESQRYFLESALRKMCPQKQTAFSNVFEAVRSIKAAVSLGAVY